MFFFLTVAKQTLDYATMTFNKPTNKVRVTISGGVGKARKSKTVTIYGYDLPAMLKQVERIAKQNTGRK